MPQFQVGQHVQIRPGIHEGEEWRGARGVIAFIEGERYAVDFAANPLRHIRLHNCSWRGNRLPDDTGYWFASNAFFVISDTTIERRSIPKNFREWRISRHRRTVNVYQADCNSIRIYFHATFLRNLWHLLLDRRITHLSPLQHALLKFTHLEFPRREANRFCTCGAPNCLLHGARYQCQICYTLNTHAERCQCGICRTYVRCQSCNHLLALQQMQYIDGENLCHACARSAAHCESCGRLSRNLQRDECQTCFREHYHDCVECGISIERGEDLCEDCRSTRFIHGHDYKPCPLFYHIPNLERRISEIYYGFELEVECERCDDARGDIARRVTDTFKGIYCKDDGSLNNGFEIVSHPMSSRYIAENRASLASLLNTLRQAGCRSSETRTCGLHIHLSRKPLSRATIYKMVKLLYGHPTLALQLSRRCAASLSEWATVSCGVKPLLRAIVSNTGAGGRYYAINLANTHTVEIRLWRGSLGQGFWASLEQARLFHEYAASVSIRSICPASFAEYALKRIRDFPHTCKTLHRHGYIPTLPEQPKKRKVQKCA